MRLILPNTANISIPIKKLGLYRLANKPYIENPTSKKLSKPSASKDRIIVSFTTWKKRHESAAKMLEYFKNQTLSPDKIFCWLSSDEYGGENVPECLQKFVDEGYIEIKWVKKNIYGHKRYEIFKDEEYNNAFVLTIDDDIIYDNRHVELMYNTAKKHPDCIITRCGNSLFRHNSDTLTNPSFDFELLSGVACFPPHTFPVNSFNYSAVRDEIALTHDDFWVKIFTIMENIKIFQIEKGYRFTQIKNTQNCALWKNHNTKIEENGIMHGYNVLIRLIQYFNLENKISEFIPNYKISKMIY